MPAQPSPTAAGAQPVREGSFGNASCTTSRYAEARAGTESVDLAGPGGPEIVSDHGHLSLAFSAWTHGTPGAEGSRRAFYLSLLDVSG